MNTLTFQKDHSALITGAIRALSFFLGLILLLLNFNDFFGSGGTFWTGLVFGVAIGLIFIAVFNANIGNAKKIILNSDFIRSEESGFLVRTAYWNKINSLGLSRFSILIKYKSGTSERFSSPLLNGDDFKKIKEELQTVSEQHDIQFSEKAWWKPF